MGRHSMDEHSLCRTVANSSGVSNFDKGRKNPFCIPLNHNWQRVLAPEDLALVRALSVQLLRQLEHPQAQLTEFESAKLTVVFGHYVVVNISRSLPESQKTLSLSELNLAMEKAGRQRRCWNRGDPTFHAPRDCSISERHHKSEGSPTFENVPLQRGNLGAA